MRVGAFLKYLQLGHVAFALDGPVALQQVAHHGEGLAEGVREHADLVLSGDPAEGTIGQMDGGDAYAIFTGGDKAYDATQDRNETGAVKLEGELGNIYGREIDSFSNSILNGTPVEVPATDAPATDANNE